MCVCVYVCVCVIECDQVKHLHLQWEGKWVRLRKKVKKLLSCFTSTCNYCCDARPILILLLKFASPCIIIHFKWINQPDATISQVYYLPFMYSSTCFGRPHAHRQELNNCSSSLWFYRGGSSAVGRGLAGCGESECVNRNVLTFPTTGPTTNKSTATTAVKPEAATAVIELLMMGVTTPETCWAGHKHQVINLRNCCIWLVDLF